MRATELILIASCALAGCKSNPDPRKPSTDDVQRTALGGWLVVTSHQGGQAQGELIAVDATSLTLLTWSKPPAQRALYTLSIPSIKRAELFRYVSEASGIGVWGGFGTLSTISHGVFLVLTAPLWVITTSIAASTETHHVTLVYPHDSMAELAKWARFPQGMPPGIDPRALVTPMPLPPPPVVPVQPVPAPAAPVQPAPPLVPPAPAAPGTPAEPPAPSSPR